MGGGGEQGGLPTFTECLQGETLTLSDEDTEEIWSRLSEKEKTEFKSMMQDGRLGELVSPWQPWWLKEQV